MRLTDFLWHWLGVLPSLRLRSLQSLPTERQPPMTTLPPDLPDWDPNDDLERGPLPLVVFMLSWVGLFSLVGLLARYLSKGSI